MSQGCFHNLSLTLLPSFSRTGTNEPSDVLRGLRNTPAERGPVWNGDRMWRVSDGWGRSTGVFSRGDSPRRPSPLGLLSPLPSTSRPKIGGHDVRLRYIYRLRTVIPRANRRRPGVLLRRDFAEETRVLVSGVGGTRRLVRTICLVEVSETTEPF